MLLDTKVDIDIFKTIINCLKDCEDVSYNSTEECIKDDAFQSVPARNGLRNSEVHGPLYVKDFCEVLQRQVKLPEKEDIMLHPEQKERMSEVTSRISLHASSVCATKK